MLSEYNSGINNDIDLNFVSFIDRNLEILK